MKFASLNPATEKVFARYTAHTLSQALRATENAQKAFLSWKDLPVSSRLKPVASLARLLRVRKDEFATLITNEMGKPITQAKAEVEKCALVCDYYVQNAQEFLNDELIATEYKKSYVAFEPLGIILGVMPWNFPFWQVFRFAIPALCAGNVCILKHSTNVPGCALALEDLFSKAGFGKGVFTTLLIKSDVVQKLIELQDVRGVSLTGSVEAGRSIGASAGRNLKKVVLELGGSDPFIILEDADIEAACKTAVQSRMINNGQSCIAAKRFIVVQKVAKEFEKQFLQHVDAIKIGDPLEDSTEIGPLAREDLVKTLQEQVRKVVRDGGKIIRGGKRLPGRGYFFAPTVIMQPANKKKYDDAEIFGPVALITYVRDSGAAIEEANRTHLGLGASLWSQNTEKAEELARKIEAGMVFINSMVKSDPRLPFGGIKDSGVGRELCHYGLKEFTNTKTVVIEK